jgi:predicted ABC-type transport system involved in lysophospholipase L1 biosynthesis ATPase subunit
MVLDSLTAGFRSARLTVVSGRSGSGKSTLLAVLAGLQPPDSGTAEVIGQPLAGLDRSALAAFRAQSVAFAGQQPGLSGFLTATENIVVALAVRGIADGEAGRRAAIELRRLGLDHRAGSWSSGCRRGAAGSGWRSRAPWRGAPLVLVDEPTSRLDQASAELVAAPWPARPRRTGAAIVCATHDPLLIGRAGEVLELDQLPD